MEEMEDILQEENPSIETLPSRDHESTTYVQNVSDEEILQEENPSIETLPSLDHESTTPQNVNSTSVMSSVSDEEILQEENPSIETLPSRDHESTTYLQNVSDQDILQEENPSIETLPSRDHESTTYVQNVFDEDILQEENPSIETLPSRDHESTTYVQNVSDEGTVTAASEEEMIERIETIIDPMTEMFGTYFKPTVIATRLDSLDDSERQSILNDSKGNGERGMRSLLERLIEIGEKPLLEFYRLITTMDEDSGCLPMALLSGTGSLKQVEISRTMQFIVELVEQRNLHRLAHTDLKRIADIMVEKKLMKNPKKSLENMEDTAKGFIHLLTLFRKSNPDWPIFLWRTLQKLKPDIFKPDTEEDNPRLTSAGAVQNLVSGSSSPRLTPDKPSSECAPRTNSKTKHKHNLKQLQITPKNMRAVEFFVENGNLRPEQVTYDEISESTSSKNAWNITRNDVTFSDGEDENEETERKVPLDDADTSNLDVNLNLRKYQEELAEHALNGENTIVCARTGCGKTRVALHIIIKHLKGNAGAKSKANKVCFFARTVPLAVQQYKTIRSRLPEEYKINIFTGDSEFSSNMHMLLDELDVVVLTPMILQNHITRGNVKDLRKFSLLVFDECHHTREKEPYNNLMASYVDEKLTGARDLPQVIGLTASFPVEKAMNAVGAASSILQLCANLDAHSISVVVENKDELDKHVPVPTEKIEQLRERDNDESYKKIISVMEKLEEEAKDCAKDIGDVKLGQIISALPSDNRKLQKYNNWTVELQNRAQELPLSLKETNLSVRLLIIISQYLTKYHFALETHDLVHLEDVINYLDDCFSENKFDEFQTSGETRLYDYFKELKANMMSMCHEDNPNLRRLVDVIKDKMLKAGNLSRGIIFVRTRAIAEALASWLNRCEDEEIRNLKANIFTGTNAKESQGGMTQSQQNALVEQFKEGKLRLLVATSVAEEGMDVPECNLVIKYNHVGNEITTIQTRGRSRKFGGHSVLLAMNKTCEKEMVNQKRTLLMYEGIEIVRNMENEDFIDQVVRTQIAAKEQRELDALIASQNEKKYKHKKFRMICKLCRKFYIESDNLRTLCKNHRIVVDRDVWDQKQIFIVEPKYIDEIQIVGSVRCQSDVESGTKCRGPLGAMVFYSGNYFLAVGIKNFTIDEESRNMPRAVKKWKDLPYPLEDLSNEDIKNYIRQKEKPASGIQETESASDSHLTSFAVTVAQESISSEDLNAIYERYDDHSSQDATSALSTYSSSSSHHATYKKQLAMSEFDRGLACEYSTPESKE